MGPSYHRPPTCLLPAEGRQAPDNNGKLSKFIKLCSYKTLPRSQCMLAPIHPLNKAWKPTNILLCGPGLISEGFAGATERGFWKIPGQTWSHKTLKFTIKRSVVLEKMLWLLPSHCFFLTHLTDQLEQALQYQPLSWSVW